MTEKTTKRKKAASYPLHPAFREAIKKRATVQTFLDAADVVTATDDQRFSRRDAARLRKIAVSVHYDGEIFETRK
jgi:hypothetical protein